MCAICYMMTTVFTNDTARMCTVCAQAMVYSAFNGIGLALVIPCVQSLLADYTQADTRGHAFGVMYFTAALGAKT